MTDIAVISYHLSQVDVVSQWGCNADIPRGVETVDDNVFVSAVGQRLQLFHVDLRQRTLLPSLSASTVVIRCIRASHDHRFLAVGYSSEADKAPSCLIYDAQMPMRWSAKPRRLTFADADKAGLWFSVLEFSNNNELLFCQLNAPDHTAYIMDWQLNEVRHTVQMNTQVLHISFNPEDATRYCTCGEALLQVWRLGKRVQQIPSKGLSDPQATFTRHCWSGVSKLLVGGAQGDLWALQNCEQTQAFPQAHARSSVVAILARETQAFSIAVDGTVCQFDLAQVSRNHRSGTAVELLRQFRLEHDSVTHAVWLQQSLTALNIAVQMSTGIFEYNLGGETTQTVRPASKPSDLGVNGQEAGSCAVTPENHAFNDEELWQVLNPESALISFHSRAITDLSCCTTQSLLLSRTVSAPASRPMLRLWHRETEEVQTMLPATLMHGFDDNTPMAFHPSGGVILAGAGDRVVQYTVTLDSCCATDEFLVKGTLRSHSGESYVNSAPPSLLRYSHGGHLFVVVLGKAALVLLSYQGKNRKRNVFMILSGQSQDIVDVQFSARDDRLWTLSKDGSLYEWSVGQRAKSAEYMDKRIIPFQLSIGPFDTAMIVARQDGEHLSNRRQTKRTFQAVGKLIIAFGAPSARTSTSSSTEVAAPESPTSAAAGGRTLIVWSNGLSAAGTAVRFPGVITAIASSGDHPSANALASAGFIVLGFRDGTVTVTTWPLQLLPSPCQSSAEDDEATHRLFTLDPRAMKVLNLHNGMVRTLSLDVDAQRCYTGGDDAAVFTIQLYEDALSMEPSNAAATIVTPGTDLAVVLRASVSDTNKVVLDLQDKLVEQEREFGGSLRMKQSQQEDQHRGYEVKLARETKRRDDIIIQLRERIQLLERTHQQELQELETRNNNAISKLEYDFEAKLTDHKTQSTLAAQAYEEFVTSVRDEHEDAQSSLTRQSQEQHDTFIAERRALDQEREALLQYVDYMKEIYDSTILSIDDQHDKEIVMLRGTLKSKDDRLHAVMNSKRKELHLVRRHILNLKKDLVDRDNVFLDTREQLQRSADQIENLQQCLKQALNEVTTKTELSQHWESKAGEQSRKITELERVRKTLTSQLHELRAEMVPKDDKILDLNKRLSEVNNEYERQLKVLSTSVQDTTYRKVQATQLQRQLRGLRKQVHRREAILKHVATRCTQLGVDESIDWKEELQALARTLQPYLRSNAADDNIDEQVFEQLDRHNQKLRDSIQQMQHTITSVLISSQASSQAKMEDNKLLLEEINRQRKENKELTRLVQQGSVRPFTASSPTSRSSKSPSRAASRRQRLPQQSASVELLPSTLPLSRGTSRLKLMGARQIPQVSAMSSDGQDELQSLSTATVSASLR